MSLLLNESFRNTLSRRRAIQQNQTELEELNRQSQKLHTDIDRLQTHSGSYENLVRKELGYLRPGEKEARFVKK